MKTESLLGYVLRVSEANGYTTPWNVLDHAKISRREALSPLFPIDRLSRVLGHDPATLYQISYLRKNDTGALGFHLLSHSLGQSMRARTYRLAKSAFCPKCVLEIGYIEAHWDIALVTACPRHACKLLIACPSCDKHITYFRKGLLRCECGQDWSDVGGASVGPEVTDLQSILVSKILGYPVSALRGAGMPISQLEALPLNAFLVAIEIIGKYTAKCDKSEIKDRYALVSTAATVLSNWPTNYERLIEKLVDIGGGWLLRYFLTALSRASILEGQGSFLRDPVTRHLAALPPLHKKSLRPFKKANASSIKESINKKPLSLPNRNSMGQRLAAAFLRIPVSTLNALRVSGHYMVLNIPTPLSAYHLVDLNCFLREVLACAPGIVSDANDHIGTVTLGYALQELRFRTRTGKARLISNILNGTLIPVGRSGDTIPDILLKRTDVEALLADTRTKAEGNTVSQDDAAHYLSCDPLVIPGLSSSEHLVSVPEVGRSRITLGSLERFGKQYASISSIANDCGTSSCRLIRLCKEDHIPLLIITRKVKSRHQSGQPFVQRKYSDRLSEALAHSRVDTTKPQARLNSAALMIRYLDELKESGESLPRRTGKPNKAAIAKACGFDRNTLYLNTKVIALLDAFEIEDRQRKDANVKNSDLQKLRQYLEELKSNNRSLPCIAGKSNRAAIAKAGGFNRNVFYGNTEAMTLLSTFDVEKP